ncbi:cellulase family glycosylhydrolase [Nonomuraea mangrovi]|uniref:Cellulase family glycosylhydrolase n=1 Tax=Nonomuraea mangrovi TaxID=2316207 RepID=A0ABW4TA97_9ACTN
MRRSLALVTLAALLTAPLPAEASRTPGKITADGRTYLTDDDGRVIRLRGFNAGKYPTDRVTEDDVRAMAGKGLTFLRLIVQWQYIEPRKDVYDQEYLGYVDRVLGWADRYGLHVMIDMHQDVYGPRFGGHNGIPEWATRDDGLPFERNPGDWFQDYFQPAVMAAFEHLYEDADLRAEQVEMWQTLVRKVSWHRSLLGYDLFNEPFGRFLEGEDLVTASARIERTQLADMYRRLIAGIRVHDRKSWIFVEPTVLVGEGVPTQLPRFDDPKVGYAPHMYSTGVEAGGDWDPSSGFIERYEAAIGLYPAANQMPVIVGEWGPPNSRLPGNRRLVSGSVAAMNRFSTGWAMFYWCRSDSGGYCQLDGGGRTAPGAEPALGAYARRVAGLPVAESYDAAARTLTLTYTTRRGVHAPTEIAVPREFFPRGVRVKVSGVRSAVTSQRDGLLKVAVGARPGTAVTVTVSPR